MGDEDHRVPLPVELLQEAQHLPAGVGVQGAGGLVGQDDRGVSRQGPGDGHPLLLAAGQLGGEILLLGRQPHPLQGPDRPLPPLAGGHPGVQQGQLHVLQHVELGNQVVLLEDEAQHLVADLRLLVVVHGGHVHAPQPVGAGGGYVQTADDVHGGGLARPGGAHDGHELPLVDGEVHPVQGVDGILPHLIDLIDLLQFDEMFHGGQPPMAVRPPPADWTGTSTSSPSSRPERIST